MSNGSNVHEDGATLIAMERARQCSEEGRTPEHDDTYTEGDLGRAAAAYATPTEHRVTYQLGEMRRPVPRIWPWADEWWKPSPEDRVRELVKAGALIAAEIDRLRRADGC